MQRRNFILRHAALALPMLAGRSAVAHHGWSSFDQNRPLYLAGSVSKVQWRNPHVELVLRVAPSLALPADLAQRKLPAQSAPVDAELLAKATLPKRSDAVWEIELAPLGRMQAWGVAEIKPGAPLELVGFTFEGEKGQAVMRVEFLFIDGKTYGLRSAPA